MTVRPAPRGHVPLPLPAVAAAVPPVAERGGAGSGRRTRSANAFGGAGEQLGVRAAGPLHAVRGGGGPGAGAVAGGHRDQAAAARPGRGDESAR